MDAGPAEVRIVYRRPPDREEIFVQKLLHAERGVVVSYLDRTPLARPLIVDGETVLEQGSPAIWFTFPGHWHDVGRFHRADGTFTGIYANILTPVEFLNDYTWETTDLFLDVWLAPGKAPRVLDEDELAEAEQLGWVDRETAAAARAEAANLLLLHEWGEWPGSIVEEWTIERVRDVLQG